MCAGRYGRRNHTCTAANSRKRDFTNSLVSYVTAVVIRFSALCTVSQYSVITAGIPEESVEERAQANHLFELLDRDDDQRLEFCDTMLFIFSMDEAGFAYKATFRLGNHNLRLCPKNCMYLGYVEF